MAALVLVEKALVLCLCFLEVLVPLCWEELKNRGVDTPWVLLFELLDARKALVEHLIADYARERDMITSGLH